MVSSQPPKVLWDDCLERQAYVRSMTARPRHSLGGQVPETVVSGETADISPWAIHRWYEWVMFHDTSVPFPGDKMILGRDLGPSLDIGPAMCQKILKMNGQIQHQSSARSLMPEELESPEVQRQKEEFDAAIAARLGGPMTYLDLEQSPDPDIATPNFDPYEDDVDGAEPVMKEIDDVDTYDQYVGAEVLLQTGDQQQTARVVSRKREADGKFKGTANVNPLLDTRTYDVEFPNGQVAEYSANVIAESMYSQCDVEGNQHLLLDALVDHKKSADAISHQNMYVQHGSGNKHLRKTTRGWKLCVEWKDGSTSWERLADLKESNPVEVAEYAVSKGIQDEPAFLWWVPYTLKRRDRIIAAVNKRYHKHTHKFGIEVPKTMADAIAIDKRNGNTLWQDAIRKEMNNVRVAFKILEDGESVPPTYQQIRCHLVFDIKQEDFRWKARFVVGGHMTDASGATNYASVVSRESVHIALTLAALNDLEVKAADIQNAYLTAPTSEKIWCVLGPEFGSDAGCKALIVRALYGLKIAAKDFTSHLADCMRHLGWKPCRADWDVWMKPEVRLDDGVQYWPTCCYTLTMPCPYIMMLQHS